MSPILPMMLTDLLSLSHVPRWSIVPHSRPQSVADHSFRVTVIARELAHRMGVQIDAGFLLWALCHDAEECRTGDIPTPYKNGDAEPCPWRADLPEPTDEQRNIIHLADMIEAYTFIEKYGDGHHALRVRDELYGKLNGAPERLRMLRLVTDILYEEGR